MINKEKRYSKENDKEITEWTHQLLSFGDYDSSTAVERSNVRMWMKIHAESEGVTWDHRFSGYGGEAIAILFDPEKLIEQNTPEGQTLVGLEDYPAICGCDLSEMEEEMKLEAAENFGMADFEYSLRKTEWKNAKGIALDEMYDALPTASQSRVFWDAIREIEENYSSYTVIESGGSVWFPSERIIDLGREWIAEKLEEYDAEEHLAILTLSGT